MDFDSWSGELSPVDTAVADCEANWGKKWFMQPEHLAPAKTAIRALPQQKG
jgi:hypothetical protein